ncbi:uncharacterized protein BDZ99DRAFT_521680 [Mytilinidion resinicola]|uniref:Uncharacterized protein n=1 Tax=Mytilinidion resinicola TaxID=574789 RepID=A0A6A6YL14_9PEZI|nr:uncharacterized protein BDZ99DRAFT_521680 [Mytilinidion resinicola]KAF2809239.1 hypothetical protein BDZ99DRAFT_521680 [Mytilinidion resinicola]
MFPKYTRADIQIRGYKYLEVIAVRPNGGLSTPVANISTLHKFAAFKKQILVFFSANFFFFLIPHYSTAMATEFPVESSPSKMAEPRAALNIRPHPLQIITDQEISRARIIVENLAQEQSASGDNATRVRYKSISLHEPPKALLLPYLNAEAAGEPKSERPFVP